MPLSKPAHRRHMHTREIVCRGYKRDDGLWDIEGRITDTKSYSFPNRDRGGIAAGEPLHDMLIRLTMDGDRTIHKAEAATEHSPYNICPHVTESFSKLEGLKIEAGWRKAVMRVFGGVHGCTHLTDLLLGPLATTAVQTIIPDGSEEVPVKERRDASWLIDKCHAFASDGPVVQREFPEHYTGDDGSQGS